MSPASAWGVAREATKHRPIAVVDVYPVQKEHVEMYVEIQGTAKSEGIRPGHSGHRTAE